MFADVHDTKKAFQFKIQNLTFIQLLFLCKIDQEKVSGYDLVKKRFSVTPCNPLKPQVTPCNTLKPPVTPCNPP